MAQFKAISATAQVNGETVISIVSGMGAFGSSARKILADAGIADPQPGLWYSQQAWLDAFKAISDRVGAATLAQIGQKIPESAKFPPQIDSIDKALGAIEVAYHMNHRNGEIGHYNYAKSGPRAARMTCVNPYPCDFDRGLITAMARRFQPADSRGTTVAHDDALPCRKRGADACTYIVNW